MLAACSPLAAVAAACGIDESGLLPIDASIETGTTDGGGGDVVAYDVLNDVPLPPSCGTLDTSCIGFGGGLPDGWSPYVASFDGGACPTGDFNATQWVTNTRLGAGSCACGCTTSGTYACPSNPVVGTGNIACGLNVGAVTTGQCQTQGFSHIQLADAAATGNVTCTGTTAPAVPQADPVTLCSMGCEAGVGAFCVQPPGSRCIVTDGITTCPGSGMTAYVVGASAAPSCEPCGCTTGATPQCTGTAYLYRGYFNGQPHPDNNCDDGGQNTVETLTLDGTCQNANNGFDSYEVVFGAPPSGSCTANGPGSGDAGLASPKTVCCQ